MSCRESILWTSVKTYYAGPPGEIIDGRKYDWGWNLGTLVASGDCRLDRLDSQSRPARPSDRAQHGLRRHPNGLDVAADPLPPWNIQKFRWATFAMTGLVPTPLRRNRAASTTPPRASCFAWPPIPPRQLLVDAGTLVTAYPEFTANGGGSGANSANLRRGSGRRSR